MCRTAELHELRTGFVLVLLNDARPITTLTGANASELASVGCEWVALESRSSSSFHTDDLQRPISYRHA